MLANTTLTDRDKKRRDEDRNKRIEQLRFWLDRDYPQLSFINDEDLSIALGSGIDGSFFREDDEPLFKKAAAAAKTRMSYEREQGPRQGNGFIGNRGIDGSLSGN